MKKIRKKCHQLVELAPPFVLKSSEPTSTAQHVGLPSVQVKTKRVFCTVKSRDPLEPLKSLLDQGFAELRRMIEEQQTHKPKAMAGTRGSSPLNLASPGPLSDQWLTVEDVAGAASIGVSTLYKWCKEKREGVPLPTKVGPRASRWSRKEVESWLNQTVPRSDGADSGGQ